VSDVLCVVLTDKEARCVLAIVVCVCLFVTADALIVVQVCQ
jgi:hypothetical protein